MSAPPMSDVIVPATDVTPPVEPPTPPAPVSPIPAPEPIPPHKLPALPPWLLGVAAAGILLLGGVGVYNRYTPPTAPPTPAPTPVVNPKDVWQPLLQPTKNEVAGLKLPAPFEVSAGQKYIAVQAICTGRVRWLVSGRTTKIEALESPLINSVMIFPGSPTAADTIVVVAYSTQANGQPSDPAVTLITVKGEEPAPTPPTPPTPPEPPTPPTPPAPPTPEPAKKVMKVHVTFVYDPAKKTRNYSDIIGNVEFRAWLKANGHMFHEMTNDVEGLKEYGLLSYIQGKPLPLVILQARETGAGFGAGDVVAPAEPLIAVQQVKDFITKIAGGK